MKIRRTFQPPIDGEAQGEGDAGASSTEQKPLRARVPATHNMKGTEGQQQEKDRAFSGEMLKRGEDDPTRNAKK